MGWEKGKPRKTQGRVDIETMGQEPESEAQMEPVVNTDHIVAKVAPPSFGETFPFDTTIYHNAEEPRDLKAGQPVPEGWTREPAELTVSWKNNPDGTWIRMKVV